MSVKKEDDAIVFALFLRTNSSQSLIKQCLVMKDCLWEITLRIKFYRRIFVVCLGLKSHLRDTIISKFCW